MQPSLVDDAAWPDRAEQCDLGDLRRVVEHPEPVPTGADGAEAGVPIYGAATLTERASAGPDEAGRLRRELARVLLDGPGVLVIRAAVDAAAVDAATEVFLAMIDEQRRTGAGGGDHYAKPGANDRIWNAQEKLALAAPEVFVDYYRSDALALVCEAWLGPAYQMTAQVNVVNPGGEAQRPHRDYHLGFMSEEQAARYPAHAHRLSPVLTLQGAVAHGDMPVESGPTKLLPHSQRYEAGFLAWRRPDFVEYFEANHVQLALGHGDALFFNPAVFHAAGTNRTADVRRMANLLQISSSMGRAMERLDRRAMSLALHPVLCGRLDAGLPFADAARVVAASAEGYPFPADLDEDQPVDRLTPFAPAELALRALEERWSLERLADRLAGTS